MTCLSMPLLMARLPSGHRAAYAAKKAAASVTKVS